MKRLVVALGFALGLSWASAAVRAEPEPPASPPGIGFAGKKEPPAAAAKGGRTWGDGKTGRGPEPIAEPAKGASYNLIHIAYASVIMLAMLAFTLWLIRRNRRRD